MRGSYINIHTLNSMLCTKYLQPEHIPMIQRRPNNFNLNASIQKLMKDVIHVLCALLLGLIVRYSSGLSKYDPRKGNRLTDSETRPGIRYPTAKYQFKNYKEAAAHTGLLFAGKSEFPWVVDIRVHDGEPEQWSTGNLVSAKHVLTTCRAAKLLKFERNPDVTYFVQFVWEFHEYGLDPKNAGKPWPERLGGRRKVAESIFHKKCQENDNERTFSYDIGSVVLRTPVLENLPFIGYMPIFTDPMRPGNIPSVDLSRMEAKRQMCLVGSVGRSYVNIKGHLVRDFKVRFRVYWEDWTTCSNMMSKLCDNQSHDCSGMYPAPNKGRDWVCMKSRARVGTVCDHDRGAPLVCDDQVVGIVVFGALLDYCNDRFPMPFVVTKLNKFQNFIMKRIN